MNDLPEDIELAEGMGPDDLWQCPTHTEPGVCRCGSVLPPMSEWINAGSQWQSAICIDCDTLYVDEEGYIAVHDDYDTAGCEDMQIWVLNRKVVALRAERDRYRNALAKISGEGYPSAHNSIGDMSAQIDRNIDTARDALETRNDEGPTHELVERGYMKPEGDRPHESQGKPT